MVLFNLNLLPWVPVKPSAEEGSGGGGGEEVRVESANRRPQLCKSNVSRYE